MQRPTPLPPPPARPESAPRPAPARATLVADTSPADLDERHGPLDPDAQPTDVLTDLRPDRVADPVAAPDVPSVAAAPADDTADGSDPDAEAAVGSMGLADVWRAARARRRALRAEVRRFTVRQRRRRLVWAISAASIVALALGTLGAAYSPLFAVERVTVVGTQGLDPAAVESALADQLGTPLPRVDSSSVKAALVAFPLVESFTLEARPPHELVVRIVERTPVGVVQSPAGYTLVDAAGVALATTPDPPAGQPLLEVAGGVDGDVFAAVGQVVRSLPADLRAQVTAVSATSVDDVSFTLGGVGAQVVWGNAEDSPLKALVLATTIRQRPLGTVSVYDVSTPAAVVVR